MHHRRDGHRAKAVIGIACLLPCLASAQADLEEIVVTGTRIARPDFVSASPIVSITQQRFEDTAASTVEDVLNGLPQFVAAYGSTSNNPSNGGQANLLLRGLPGTATLVLLDGRRLMPANGTGVVDVNIVPPALIESIEVITGGASAVYGSDAVAGVVNFKLRRAYEGVELYVTGAVTDEGDGEEYSFGLSAGTDFADGRGSIAGYAGYTEREQVNHSARAFSRYSLAYVGEGFGTAGPRNAFVPAGSFAIEEGTAGVFPVPSQAAFDAVFATYGYAPGTVPYSRATLSGQVFYNALFGVNDDRTLFTLGTLLPPQPGAVANYRGPRDYPVAYNDRRFGYNFAPDNALQLPLERTSLFARADYELSESATLFGQALYAAYSVSTQLAPTPVTSVTVPVTNPYIPPDLGLLLASRAAPSVPFGFQRRMTSLGPRVSENNYDVYQVTVGAHGSLSAGWRYDAYLQAGQNDNDEQQSNNVRRSRYEELLYAADGGASICGGYDPFGRAPITPQCASYIAVDGTNRTTVEQRIAEFSVSGPAFTLPAGDVQLVLGAMYKEDAYRYGADPISKSFLPDGRSEVIGFSASDDVDGEDDNTDLYVEVSVPMLAEMPGVMSLEAILGYRWSDYASAGSVEAYKAELLYRPVESIRVRGSFQHAVRAPSVYELYRPQLGPEVFVDEVNPDPCSVGSVERAGPDSSRVEALCVAHGLPAALLSTYTYNDFVVDGVTGGNPDLDVEEADTYTAGLVVRSTSTSRWIERLQGSLDWYRIEVQDAIAMPPAAAFVPRCYDARYNPSFAVDNVYCTFFARDTVTGEIRDAMQIYRNIGVFRTSGIDLQLDWSVALGPGDVSISWLVAWVDSFERSAAPGVEADELVGLTGGVVGGSLPEWKWNLRAGYTWSSIDVALQWRYVDSTEDAGESVVWRIPSRDYLDLSAGYEFATGFLAGLRLRAGIENLADADPPIFPSYVQANTDPSQFDTLGRRYFASATYRF